MKRSARRIVMWLIIALSGATMFQGVGFTSNNGAFSNGCSQFYTNGVLTGVDFCFLLDCQNGFFGGLVDPCAQGNLLVDCPGSTTTTNQGTTTTTTTKTIGEGGMFGF